jgi:hypothetical protein
MGEVGTTPPCAENRKPISTPRRRWAIAGR